MEDIDAKICHSLLHLILSLEKNSERNLICDTSLVRGFDSGTFISVSWTRKERDSVVLVGAVAVGIVRSSLNIPYHPPGCSLGSIELADVAERHSVAVDGVVGGIDSAVAVAAHSRNRPDCCCHLLPPCCWDNTHCHHRDHHRCFHIPLRCAYERTGWPAAGFLLHAENLDPSLPAADFGRWPCSWWQ